MVELLDPWSPSRVVVLVSVLVDDEGSFSFTTVVLFSVLFCPGGLTVVVSDFSQAASKAAPANNAMYFFIKVSSGC